MDFAAVFLLGEYVRYQDPASRRLSEYLAVAAAVAGQGKPDCTAYDANGQAGQCMPRFSVRHGSQVNAWQLGGHIQFSQAAVMRLSLDEFALLAGHEIAHYYLGHRGNSREQELQADALGAILACRAGYNPDQASSLYRYARRSRTHPEASLRRKIVMEIAPRSNCTSAEAPSILALNSQ